MSDVSALHEQVLYSQVRVKVGQSGGSGTIIYSEPSGPGSPTYNTYALTCHHVIDDAIAVKDEWDPKVGRQRRREIRQLVTVEFFDWSNVAHGNRPLNYSADAEIMAYDKDHDMAVLRLRTIKRAPYVAALMGDGDQKVLTIGSRVVAVGSALLHDPILTEGIITHFGDEIDGKLYWMSNAQIIFGNCLPASERVFTTTGPKSIAEVREGEFVYSRGATGWEESRVLRHMQSGTKRILKIRTNTRTIRLSDNHPLLTPNGWVEAGQLSRGDEIAVFTGTKEGDAKDATWLWLVGLFLGDGVYRDRGPAEGYEVSFSVFGPTRDDLCAALTELGYDFHVDDMRGVSVHKPKRLLETLRTAGIATGFAEKRIPAWAFSLDYDGRLAMLRGLVDSDGHIDARGDWRFELNNQALVQDIRDLAIGMGCRVSNLYTRERPWAITNQVGNMYSGLSKSYAFVIFWQDLEKSRAYRHVGFDDFDRIKSIEDDGYEGTFDLEIAGTHNFIASGLVVHNSGGAVFHAGARYSFIGIPSRVAVSGWGNTPVTHLGYFSPIPRVHEFFREQTFDFLTPGSGKTEVDCEAERRSIRDREERKLLVEAPTTPSSMGMV